MSQFTPGPWLDWLVDPRRLPEGTANARLIAAAPDLLSALKSTLSTLDFAIQKGVLECHGVREAALAAIAKAEGAA